jgi:biopolymer transport protein ExbD
MQLRRARPPAPEIPVIPLVNLALLVGTCVIVAAMLSASRGPGLRFASTDRDGTLGEEDAVRVEVSSEQEARVDGTPVPFDLMAVELARRLAGRPHPAVILVVSPEASYETMVAALAAIEGLPGPPRIALPTVAPGHRG